jgi:hypothetical protein
MIPELLRFATSYSFIKQLPKAITRCRLGRLFPSPRGPTLPFAPAVTNWSPSGKPTQTAWVWEDEILYRTPGSSLATEDVLAELAASGVCLIGSNIRKIPIVPTDEVFAKFEAAVTTTQVVEGNSAHGPDECSTLESTVGSDYLAGFAVVGD